MNNKSTITVDWCITGYHRYKIKPDNGEILWLFREPDNKFHPWAILVKRKDGTVVGRVPANLCRTFQLLKNNKIASNFSCKFTGITRQSSKPHYLERFQRSEDHKTLDKAGGGVVLSCIYSYSMERDKGEEMKEIIKANIKTDDLSRFAWSIWETV